MLYIALLLAVVFYVSLFVMWGAIQPQLNNATSLLASLQKAITVVPDQTAMILLRELILLTMVYLVFDGALSLVRRTLHGKTPRHSWHDYPASDGASDSVRREDVRPS